MKDLSKTQVLSARVEFLEQKFRTPMQLSTGLIEVITEARATVRVKVGEAQAEGRGAIYLSDLWAWPDPELSHEVRDAALRERCQEIADALGELTRGAAHPLELGLRLHHSIGRSGTKIPALAEALCLAPFDAAIHDAAGRALGISAFSFYQEPASIPSADGFFVKGTVAAIANMMRPRAEALDGWWIVNARDDLGGELACAISEAGFRNFKLKLLGRSVAEDVARTVSVHRAVLRHGACKPRLSLDSNEAHGDANAVREFLEALRASDLETFNSVSYLEQPTSRDIIGHGFSWHEVSLLKPVLLDEGLTSLELLPHALEQGWSGLALKTCKGHSFALAAAAWAHEHGLLLTMQDLTNPGLAAIHSYLFAAHLPVINGIELNSPQFTPQANALWLPRLSGLFGVRDGRHRLAEHAVGLGSEL